MKAFGIATIIVLGLFAAFYLLAQTSTHPAQKGEAQVQTVTKSEEEWKKHKKHERYERERDRSGHRDDDRHRHDRR